MNTRRLRRYSELRHLRKRQEDMKAQKYANAVRSIQLAEEERSALESRRMVMVTESAVSEGSVIDVEQQRRLQQYERHLARCIVEQDVLIHERTVIASEKHAEMTESVKLRKMMESLRDKSREEITHEWKRQEQFNIDEIATVQSAIRTQSKERG